MDNNELTQDLADVADSKSAANTLPFSSAMVPARSRVGRFLIDKEVGRGGFGVVYLATDEVLKRSVALKIPRDEMDLATKERFLREAEAAASLDHPGLVSVFEAGEVDGVCYMASAYCDGGTLARWLTTQSTVPLRAAATIVQSLAEAIQHAHDRGVVHRDLKPQNIMLTAAADGLAGDEPPFVARVTDFGLAKVAEWQLNDTHSSVILGTPCYMSPEQITFSGDGLFPRAPDIYALGVILYELLTGRRPFESDNVVEIMDAIRQQDAPPVRRYRDDVPCDLETICLKCLCKLPEERYHTSGELAQDLASWLAGRPIVARRPGFLNRLQRWAANPARVREAGAMSILLGVSIPIWFIASIIQIDAQGFDPGVTRELIPHAIALSATLLLPLAWIGYRIRPNAKGWVKAGLVMSLLNLLMVIGPLVSEPLIFTDVYGRHPMARVITFTFMSMLFTFQTVHYAVILFLGMKAKLPLEQT